MTEPTTPVPTAVSRRKQALFALFLVLVIPLLAFVLVEGASSALVLTQDLLQRPDLPPERRYTEYDEDLGWISRPAQHIPDMYGPGVSLRTNRQRLRSLYEFTPAVPPGRIRVVCTGDSFTLGFGVADEQSWCHRLQAKDPRIEPVNMGQAGYGVDQAYLWYNRDAGQLEHDVHVFAFIWDNFTRMQAAAMYGYGKPVLAIEDGRLVTRNVPVPRRGYTYPWLTTWLKESREALRSLRSFELARRLRATLTDHAGQMASIDTATWNVAARMFRDLAEHHRSRGSALVLVHLPALDDPVYRTAPFWRARLEALAHSDGLEFIDLGQDLAEVPADSVSRLFLPDGHYSAAGNDWVAERLYSRLLQSPGVGPRLAQTAERKAAGP